MLGTVLGMPGTLHGCQLFNLGLLRRSRAASLLPGTGRPSSGLVQAPANPWRCFSRVTRLEDPQSPARTQSTLAAPGGARSRRPPASAAAAAHQRPRSLPRAARRAAAAARARTLLARAAARGAAAAAAPAAT